MSTRFLPRRQAWSSSAEFNQVFDLLFSSVGDVASQRTAVARLHAWQSRSPSAYAPSLAATASFVSLLLPADVVEDDPSPRRLALSMALTRFVNGLVDPLQQSYYARSIGQIAQELELPAWFVELRHRATHEDLPSEAMLREAATQALDWLYARYWLPTLHSLSATSSAKSEHQSMRDAALSSLLQKYKMLQKSSLADSTAVDPRKLVKTIHEVEVWVDKAGAEAVAARGGAGLEGAGEDPREAEEVESVGVAMLVERLAEVEVLVPRSRKKRTLVQTPAPLSDTLLVLYEPLLASLNNTYPSFLGSLVLHLVGVVTAAPPLTSAGPRHDGVDSKEEESYFATLAGWIGELIAPRSHKAGLELEQWEKRQPLKRLLLSSDPYSLSLLRYLRKAEPSLFPERKRTDALLGLRNDPPFAFSGFEHSSTGTEHSAQRLAAMQERWLGLLNSQNGSKSRSGMDVGPPTRSLSQQEGHGQSEARPCGWKFHEADRWMPCPIGTLPGGIVPDLTTVW